MPRRVQPFSLDDFYIRVALSPNPGESFIQKFGRNPDVDSAAPEDVWDRGGDWIAPTAARIHNIVSTSANDTSTGTGARTVQILGLDANFDEINETRALGGTSPQPTVNAYTRIFRMIVRTAGSGGSNEGTITATAQVDGTVTAQINPTNNQTLMAIYTVPNGKRGAIETLYASIVGGAQDPSAQIFALFRENQNAPWRTGFYFGLSQTGTGAYRQVFNPPVILEPRTDLRLRCAVSANNTDIGGGFSVALFNDPGT